MSTDTKRFTQELSNAYMPKTTLVDVTAGLVRRKPALVLRRRLAGGIVLETTWEVTRPGLRSSQAAEIAEWTGAAAADSLAVLLGIVTELEPTLFSGESQAQPQVPTGPPT